MSIAATSRAGDADSDNYSTGERLDRCFTSIGDVQDICQTPSVSFGVLHEGKITVQKSRGLRDVENKLDATPETSYMLSSCSKMFLVASIGICVDEGKLSWNDPICKHVPAFNPRGDPKIRENATIRHALSHITGLGKQQPLLFGPNGALTATKDTFVDLVNQANTEDEHVQRFSRQYYSYNNLACGLATLALEYVTGERYADFLQSRILGPLGMTRTIVTSTDLAAETNLAYGYAKVESDENFARIDTQDYTNEGHSPVLSVTGIYSSVTDLLKWAQALLEAYNATNTPIVGNPLRQLRTIWEPVVESNLGEGTSYCMGFYRGTIPTPYFGGISLNNKLRESDEAAFAPFVIGASSKPRQFIGHSGNWNGYTAAFYLFPETQSAVVTLANAMDLGDAADFVAKILTQALFDFKPKVDVVDFARKEAALFQKWFEDMHDDWIRAREADNHEESPLQDYIGTYKGLATTINIFIDEESKCLAFDINGNLKSRCTLEFYDKDAYSFLPTTRDSWLRKGMLDWDYYGVGLFYFIRDKNEQVARFCWMYEMSEPTGWFQKATDPTAEVAKDHYLNSIGSTYATANHTLNPDALTRVVTNHSMRSETSMQVVVEHRNDLNKAATREPQMSTSLLSRSQKTLAVLTTTWV